MAKLIRGLVSKKKKRFVEDGYDLDLTYVTTRIIAMGFPSTGLESMYRNPGHQVKKLLDERHGDKYKVYNLCSEKDNSINFPDGERFPFYDHNPCPLKMILEFCISVADYLKKCDQNVVAIHCKAGKGRTGMMISSYLVYSGQAKSAEEALSRFEVERTHDWSGVTIPSQRRYVKYCESVLHSIHPGHVSAPTFQLKQLKLLHLPAKYFSSLRYDVRLMVHSEYNKWKEYRVGGGKCEDGMYSKESQVVSIQCPDELLLRGDVKFSFSSNKKRLFSAWLHTAFLSPRYVNTFPKDQLDKAYKDTKDKAYPAEFAFEIMLDVADESAELVDTFIGSDDETLSTESSDEEEEED